MQSDIKEMLGGTVNGTPFFLSSKPKSSKGSGSVWPRLVSRSSLENRINGFNKELRKLSAEGCGRKGRRNKSLEKFLDGAHNLKEIEQDVRVAGNAGKLSPDDCLLKVKAIQALCNGQRMKCLEPLASSQLRGFKLYPNFDSKPLFPPDALQNMSTSVSSLNPKKINREGKNLSPKAEAHKTPTTLCSMLGSGTTQKKKSKSVAGSRNAQKWFPTQIGRGHSTGKRRGRPPNEKPRNLAMVNRSGLKITLNLKKIESYSSPAFMEESKAQIPMMCSMNTSLTERKN